MVVPILLHEVKVRWSYFTFSRTQLGLLSGYVVSTICRDNNLEQGWAISGPRATCGPPQLFSGPQGHSGKIIKSEISSNLSQKILALRLS